MKKTPTVTLTAADLYEQQRADEESLEYRRRNERPKGVGACEFDETPYTGGHPEAAPSSLDTDGTGTYANSQRVVRVVMMRPRRRPTKLRQRALSIGSMQPGPL